MGITTAHFWYDSHSTSINTCEMLGTKIEVQVSKKELHTHLHLD